MRIVLELDGLLAKPWTGERDPFFIGDIRKGMENFLVHEIPALARRHRIASDGYEVAILTDRFDWPVVGRAPLRSGKFGGMDQERRNRQIIKAIGRWCYTNGLPNGMQVYDWDYFVEGEEVAEGLFLLNNKIVPDSVSPMSPEDRAFQQAVFETILPLMPPTFKSKGVDHEKAAKATDTIGALVHPDERELQTDRGASRRPKQLHEYKVGVDRASDQSGGRDATVSLRHDSNSGGDRVGSGLEAVREEPPSNPGSGRSSDGVGQQQTAEPGDGERDTGDRVPEDAASGPANNGQPEGGDQQATH